MGDAGGAGAAGEPGSGVGDAAANPASIYTCTCIYICIYINIINKI